VESRQALPRVRDAELLGVANAPPDSNLRDFSLTIGYVFAVSDLALAKSSPTSP
jgi:hypothetical protein